MTKEEKLFNDNIRLAYKIAESYKINYPNEFEDIQQIALLHLWNCCKTFDPNKAQLSTYSYTYMRNGINYYLRHVKKHYSNDVSMNTPVLNCKKDANSLTLGDIIADDFDVFDEIDNKINLNIIKNFMYSIYLTEDEKTVLSLRLKGHTQQKIGLITNKKQPTVSRILKRVERKIKNCIEGE